MRRGSRAANAREPTAGRGCNFIDARSGLAFIRSSLEGHRDLTRYAFLQQKLSRLDHRFGVEAIAHHSVEQRIRKRHDGHALVVRHESAHDRDLAVGRDTAGSVIKCFVESVNAKPARGFDALEVPQCSLRLDHRAKRGRIRRNDAVVAKSAFQPQAGHSEI